MSAYSARWRQWLVRYWSVLVFACTVSNVVEVHADDVSGKSGKPAAELLEDTKPRKAQPSVFVNVGSIADTAQEVTSDRFNRFVLQIDDFFGGAESEAERGASWARLRLDGIKPGAEDWEFKARLKLKVVLPQAEERLRLLVSNESADVNGGASRQSIESSDDEQNVALALRFVRSVSKQIQLNFDVGARVRERKGQVFGRISSANSVSLPSGWEQQITNNFYLYSASGYQNRFQFNLRKSLNSRSSVFFRSSTTLEGEKGIGGASVNETLGFYADISERTAVAVESLFSFVTSKHAEYDTRYLGAEHRIRFRQNIWRPWFFYEIWPTVSYLASNDYERAWGGLLRVEMLFGDY